MKAPLYLGSGTVHERELFLYKCYKLPVNIEKVVTERPLGLKNHHRGDRERCRVKLMTENVPETSYLVTLSATETVRSTPKTL